MKIVQIFYGVKSPIRPSATSTGHKKLAETMIIKLLHFFLLLLLGSAAVHAFPIFDRPKLRTHPASSFSVVVSFLSSEYGKQSEIWPPAGADASVDIRDSFPGGAVPTARGEGEGDGDECDNDEDPPPPVVRWKRAALTDRLLRRAARRSRQRQPDGGGGGGLVWATDGASGGGRSTATTALLLLLAASLVRYLRPLDVLLVVAATGYCIVLQKLAAQQRSSGDDNHMDVTPILPALPPQGHVPVVVQNPLGFRLSQSRPYGRWLKLGEILGLAGPLVLLLLASSTTQSLLGLFAGGGACNALALAWCPTTETTAPLIARPLFFLCCQAATENAVTRQVTTPLPIRILVPILYNLIRLGLVWNWALCSHTPLGAPSRYLAVANLAYTAANLWGFLVPVASLRYLRAHFFAVEAAQVVTRPGMEDSVGFL